MEKEEAAASAAVAPPRKLRRRNTEDAAAKALADNFKGWASQQTDCVLRDGKSLREAVMEGKRAAQRGEVKLGKNYYDALRRKYEDPDSPLSQLPARSADGPIDEKLKTR